MLLSKINQPTIVRASIYNYSIPLHHRSFPHLLGQFKEYLCMSGDGLTEVFSLKQEVPPYSVIFSILSSFLVSPGSDT